MKTTNKKNYENNNNNNMSLNESDEDNRDDNFSDEEQEKNQEKNKANLFIHVTLITQLIKKTNGEYPCICHNLSKEDCENDKINYNSINNINFNVIKDNFSNNLNLMNNNIPPITSQNMLLSSNVKLNQNKSMENINNYNFNKKDNQKQNNNINNDINVNSTFYEEEIVPNLEIQMTNDGKIFMKNIINKLKLFIFSIGLF